MALCVSADSLLKSGLPANLLSLEAACPASKATASIPKSCSISAGDSGGENHCSGVSGTPTLFPEVILGLRTAAGDFGRVSEWCLMGGKVLTEPSERTVLTVLGVRGERRRGWEVACGLFLLPGKKARSRAGAEVGVRGG